MEYLWGVVILLVIGALLGLLLAVASKAFAVKEDKRLEPVTAMMPGINCGTCGYPGCKELVAAILKGEVKNLGQCRPLRPDAKAKIKEYLADNPDEDGNVLTLQG
ncbi:MAG: ferredoxin [Tenericutes bacterium ADurb.Bin087]|nr:MAG: ferredoxin [Tenericutes bacterium ADurb.Bin087]